MFSTFYKETYSYIKPKRLIGVLYWNFYSYTDRCTITSETLSDYGVVPPGVHQLSLGFLGTVTSIKTCWNNVHILLFVAEICTYSATHFAQKSASKIYQGLHTSIQETTKALSVIVFLFHILPTHLLPEELLHTRSASDQQIQPHYHNPLPITLCSNFFFPRQWYTLSEDFCTFSCLICCSSVNYVV